jgi:phospholipid transport system substrate-binding protein
MAKLTLGKKYWPDLSEEKRARYIQLFINRLKTSYLDKLTLYTDEKVVFEPPVQVGKKVQIPTQLVSKERKTSILYKLYKSEEAWKVYDLEIQGVSIIRSYRSQFDEILQKGTIDDLLKKLEQPANT